MDRNEREAQEYERAAKQCRDAGRTKRADNYQACADRLRDEVKRGTPVYRKVQREKGR